MRELFIGCAAIAIVFFLSLGVTFLMVSFLYWLICLGFSLEFNWLIALGITAIITLLHFVFGK